jgi:hypothetical protein
VIATLKLKNKPGTGKTLSDTFDFEYKEGEIKKLNIKQPNVAADVISGILDEELLSYDCSCVWLFANSDSERTLILKKVNVL